MFILDYLNNHKMQNYDTLKTNTKNKGLKWALQIKYYGFL